jgi:uncharacterized protein (DUF486 family)
LNTIARTAGRLVLSNIFMTFAWYAHLKVMQEVITLLVFVPFAVLYMRQPMRFDFLWAALCLVGAVCFVIRG